MPLDDDYDNPPTGHETVSLIDIMVVVFVIAMIGFFIKSFC
jgi:hypothetical protein